MEEQPGTRQITRMQEEVDEKHFPGTQSFLDLLHNLSQPEQVKVHPEWAAAHALFRWAQPVVVSRAPGRMDVMGGIADYSGALVLQMPLQEACFCALQLTSVASDGHASVVSLGAQQRDHAYQLPMAALYPDGQPLSYEKACQLFAEHAGSKWVGYVLGCLLVLSQELGITFEQHNVSILLSSSVPEGKGVSSSASLEVAVMCALRGALKLEDKLPGTRVAVLCQIVENLVVGAPCGIMDQMASALGEQDQLLALLCQPAQVQGCVGIPPHLKVWGIDSGVRHSVGGSDYAAVRVGAFMGLKIVHHLKQQHSADANTSSTVNPVKERSQNAGATRTSTTSLLTSVQHLAQISPSQYQECLHAQLPGSMCGKDFVAAYGPHLDTATTIQPDTMYAVRQPTAHPIHEHARVQLFRQLLQAPASDEQCMLLGELMCQSHASYSACKLGSEGTDRLVQLVRTHMQHAQAAEKPPVLYGAKITGGGCGGTVCILGANTQEADTAVHSIATQHWAEQGGVGSIKVFTGSSGGALKFGHTVLHVSS